MHPRLQKKSESCFDNDGADDLDKYISIFIGFDSHKSIGNQAPFTLISKYYYLIFVLVLNLKSLFQSTSHIKHFHMIRLLGSTSEQQPS